MHITIPTKIPELHLTNLQNYLRHKSNIKIMKETVN